jgi:phenylpropionate dioxygenase-like ring-hydroxylating dioxygenase large terminal subunit
MQPEFNFFQHWYPLTPIEDLDPQQPTAVTVLGQRLVIWKPKTALEYCVFLDQCPHRLAPLSEGRVDEQTGHLMCSYHGWQFNAQGTCVTIPQIDNPELLPKLQAHLGAIALPTRQANDLLWVWMDADSPDLAAATALPLSPQIDRDLGFVWSSFMRDLEYDWQTLVENVADPSHVPFAHHGVQGDRNRARPIPIHIETSTMERIEASTNRVNTLTPIPFATTITFEPPTRLEYAIQLGNGKQIGLVTYCIPTVPGKCRIVAQFPRNFAKLQHRLIPRWFEHIQVRNAVLDGDMILLQQQEQYLRQRQASETWKTAYQLPTTADRLVVEVRRWFDQYAQGQFWHHHNSSTPPLTSLLNERRVLLDRYRQHTQICKSCRTALHRLRYLQMGLVGFAIVAIATTAVLPDGWRSSVGLPLTGLALIGLSLFAWLKWQLEPKFYFIDYVHAER